MRGFLDSPKGEKGQAAFYYALKRMDEKCYNGSINIKNACPFFLERILFAEAAEGPHRTTGWHVLQPDTSPTEFSRFCYSLARNNYPWADVITSSTEAAGLRPHLKRHAHFSTHPSSNKPEGFPVHLFVTHSDA